MTTYNPDLPDARLMFHFEVTLTSGIIKTGATYGNDPMMGSIDLLIKCIDAEFDVESFKLVRIEELGNVRH